ncbi:MAG: glycosyltransferase [Chloroflexota bacterium]
MAEMHAPTSAGVLPEQADGAALQQAVMTVDVVVPAFNEASCIRGVLEDLSRARQEAWFQVKNIHVISDASTDGTDAIVRAFAATNPRVRLIRKEWRRGKQDSVNLALSITRADVIVFIDADVRMVDEYSLARLLEHMRDGRTALVQGGLVRAIPSFTMHAAKLAAHFDWLLVGKLRTRKPLSWWSVDGRVMALSADFYRDLHLPLSLADDQFIFYSCIKQGRRFVWARDAVFYYGPPVSIWDFSHQWTRYFFYTRQSREYFGRKLVSEEMALPGLWRDIAQQIARHPLCGIAWLLCHGISRIEYVLRIGCHGYRRGLFWTKSKLIEREEYQLVERGTAAQIRVKR